MSQTSPSHPAENRREPVQLTPASARAIDAYLAKRAAATLAVSDAANEGPQAGPAEAIARLIERDAIVTPADSGDRLVRRTLRVARAHRLAAGVSLSSIAGEDATAADAYFATRASGGEQGPMPPGSADRTRRLGDLLSLIDADTPEADAAAGFDTASEDRVAATLAACREARQRRRFAEQAAMFAHARAPQRSAPWRQVMAAAGVALLALSLLLPALAENRRTAERIACAANLGLAGQGLARYAADHAGLMPRAPMAEQAKWWNVGHTAEDGRVQSNSAHLYLIVRGGYVTPDDLTCPNNPHADDAPLTANHHDWQSPEQVSFSFHNVSGRSIRLVRTPDLAVLADKNPLFVVRDGRVAFDPTVDISSASRAHGGRGQNVLRADGVVVWTLRPVLRKHDLFGQPSGDDAKADNIWVAAGVREYHGDETPTSEDDSFLVP